MVIVQSEESLDEGILLEASGALPHSASSPLLDFPYISFCFFAQKTTANSIVSTGNATSNGPITKHYL